MAEQHKKTREEQFREGLAEMPQAFQEWVKELGWKLEDITDLDLDREILSDGTEKGPDGKTWSRWKAGKHIDVTIERNKQEKQFARFVVSNGGWQRKADYDVTPLQR